MLQKLCIETIAVENRQLKNIRYHEDRLNKTRKALWGASEAWNLSELIVIPDTVSDALHKCRLAYGREIDNIRWEAYAFRTIRTIQKVHQDEVDYAYKYDQRPQLNALFADRGKADEILIIKQGMVTDSYYGNVAFKKDEKWYTPDTYLLPGTQRAFLLDSGIIEEARIAEEDIRKYSHIRLFNAMVGWKNAVELGVETILG
ncbi:hypothetical protein DYBT9275_04188 [Dyadobacter sp. CECT 9275]|uniref:4-amino-4-deoxychorismate lyase n=1 Tax=Dyadobacter helix TaxID=2822344 RepID=A0A916JG90_9BACT|nr:aminotransferase class IV [Dyadobacter sp. CECT 9275]CAG5008075.1 hypothetical protein DYBT9275_04188 [Dyadobacter sp. CECT 9275]